MQDSKRAPEPEGDAGDDSQQRAQLAKPPLSPFRLPADTAPTWEVELLLSGGTLFALMQLPGWLSRMFGFWEARVGDGMLYVISFGLMYSKVIIFAIVAALIVHLLTRGLWVAAIGLRSAYPGGIRWRSLRQGARFRAVARTRVPTLKRIIDRSDDLASQMFAVAALLVVMTLYSLVGTLLVFGMAWVLSLAFGGQYLTEWVLILVAVLTLSQIVATWFDRRARLRGRRRRPMRWALGVFRFHLVVPFARLSQALMLVFTSHFGSVRGTLFLTLALYALIGMAIADLVFEREGARLGPARSLHDLQGARVMADVHYADRRKADSLQALTPYIDSATPTARYLQLVIPFHPRRHPYALESHCPGALAALETSTEALEKAGEMSGNSEPNATARADIELADQLRSQALATLLSCVADLHAPTLDGSALKNVELLYGAGDHQQPAFVAWLPLHALARGRHVLELRALPDPPSSVPFGESRLKLPGPPLRIPFWR